MMIQHETQNETQDDISTSIIEDTRWVVAGVIVSLALVAIVYFGLTFYPSF
ncbi:MAG: hypothetical protein V3V95_06050 [Thermodesulfobacteriota bacterium]